MNTLFIGHVLYDMQGLLSEMVGENNDVIDERHNNRIQLDESQ